MIYVLLISSAENKEDVRVNLLGVYSSKEKAEVAQEEHFDMTFLEEDRGKVGYRIDGFELDHPLGKEEYFRSGFMEGTCVLYLTYKERLDGR